MKKTAQVIITLIVVLGLNSPAWARMPRPREFCGKLAAIVAAEKEISVSDTSSQLVAAVWDRHTIFIHDGKMVDATALNAGDRVCIYYRSPFIGPKYLTKVTW